MVTIVIFTSAEFNKVRLRLDFRFQLNAWRNPIIVPEIGIFQVNYSFFGPHLGQKGSYRTMAQPSCPYVSRGGLKLQAALEAFEIDPTGLICADLGASTGGFTDCLLKNGAAAVYAVDTAYGQLAWTLRQDERVVVLERSNALHLDPREPGKLPGFAGVDLVCIDLGWTRQERALPAAQRWLKPDPDEANKRRIISLIKPHYEVDRSVLESHGSKGILDEDEAESTLGRLLEKMPDLSMKVINWIRSPILGGGGGRKGKPKQGSGNVEYLALLEPESKTK